jgi:hypothetical protein
MGYEEALVRWRQPPQSDVETKLTAFLDAAMCSDVGAIIIRDVDVWKCLDPSTPGYVLSTQGPGLPPVWVPGGTAFATPAFTAFAITGQAQTIEVGATISAGSKTFTWSTSNSTNITANSISIVDTTASNTLATGLANTGSDAITISAITNNAPASQVWTINGVNTQSATFSRTFTVNWLWRVYAGTNSSGTLTANQIKALSDSSSLQASFAGTYNLSAGDYKYFSYPDSMGSVNTFRDANTGFLISMATSADDAAYSNTANGWSYAIVSVTNTNGISTNYRVYRSQYVLGGSLSMTVS